MPKLFGLLKCVIDSKMFDAFLVVTKMVWATLASLMSDTEIWVLGKENLNQREFEQLQIEAKFPQK
jgi:hypothetical protein